MERMEKKEEQAQPVTRKGHDGRGQATELTGAAATRR
jgi:hypothetical protein